MNDEEADQKHFVKVGRYFTLLIMIFAVISSSMINTIDGAAKFLIACGAGLGLVLILRWYHWRINAWSEISAMIAAFIGYFLATKILFLEFPYSFLFTTAFTTIVWIVVTVLTPPETQDILEKFYNQIQPMGRWKNIENQIDHPGDFKYRVICWLAAITMTYCTLFFTGYLIFANYPLAILNISLAACALFVLRRYLSKIEIIKS